MEQMIVFRGFFGGGSCDVFLIFRRARLARVEYCRNIGGKTQAVRGLDLLPTYVLSSDWRTRCVAIWWFEDDELDAIDFGRLGIERAVVDGAMMVNGLMRSATKIGA